MPLEKPVHISVLFTTSALIFIKMKDCLCMYLLIKLEFQASFGNNESRGWQEVIGFIPGVEGVLKHS